MTSLAPYRKALAAFAASLVMALIYAVRATPHSSLREVGTLGWLLVAASVLGISGGVYVAPNRPPDPPTPQRLTKRLETVMTSDTGSAVAELQRVAVIADKVVGAERALNIAHDQHATARRIALGHEKRRPWNVNLGRVVPDCGTPPIG